MASNGGQSEICTQEVKEKILSGEDPSKWNVQLHQKCLLKLGQSASGTKEHLIKRITNLKENPLVLEKITQEKSRSYKLLNVEIPPVHEQWLSDSKHYPKVNS